MGRGDNSQSLAGIISGGRALSVATVRNQDVKGTNGPREGGSSLPMPTCLSVCLYRQAPDWTPWQATPPFENWIYGCCKQVGDDCDGGRDAEGGGGVRPFFNAAAAAL